MGGSRSSGEIVLGCCSAMMGKALSAGSYSPSAPTCRSSRTTECQVKFCDAWQHAQAGQVVVQHLERVLLAFLLRLSPAGRTRSCLTAAVIAQISFWANVNSAGAQELLELGCWLDSQPSRPHEDQAEEGAANNRGSKA